jgi:hypothetical protein
MSVKSAPSTSHLNITSENQMGTSSQQLPNSVENVLNLRHITDDYLTRKKNKKRDTSPPAALLLPSTTMNSPSASIANELTLSSNPFSNGAIQAVAPASSNSANFTNLSATTSTTTSLAVPPPPATTIQIITKKEKQRPETWNKIEQQIFFNALRQVTAAFFLIINL